MMPRSKKGQVLAKASRLMLLIEEKMEKTGKFDAADWYLPQQEIDLDPKCKGSWVDVKIFVPKKLRKT